MQIGNTLQAVAVRLLSAIACCALLGCDLGRDADLAALAGDLSLPPAQLTGVVFEGYAAGARDLLISAATAEVDSSGGVARLEKVMILFAQEERGRTRITAPHAEFRLDSDDFLLTGGVEGTTQDGDRFVTDEVRYEHERRKLYSSSGVRVERENLKLKADGMELDVATRSLKLTGRVQANMNGGS
ncbi:MAG: LPS export ABC transporter periplasmic protein LptC [bacterium]|nr:LPS export ABC transporter periplasmic protein LptC [bacterium]